MRRLRELMRERFNGFAPSTGLRVKVRGARSIARFIVTSQGFIDGQTLPRVMPRTTATQRGTFAEIVNQGVVDAPIMPRPFSVSEKQAADELFADSGLESPRHLSDVVTSEVDATAGQRWLKVDVQVATYLPGSTVFLAVTSDPIVLDAVTVGRDGTATLSSTVPMHLLSFGEHRIRVVGIRDLEGASTDGDG